MIFLPSFHQYLTQVLKNAVKIRLKVGTSCVPVVLDQNSKFSSTIPCQILSSTAEGETRWKRN